MCRHIPKQAGSLVRTVVGAVACLTVILNPQSASAASISALTIGNFNQGFGNFSPSTEGYVFNVTSSGIIATALSILDVNFDGLAVAHDVGLWDPSGNLIASATIPAGTIASLLDGFRYVNISAIALPVANGYIVGAFFPDANDAYAGLSIISSVTTAPGIVLVSSADIGGPALTEPLPYGGLIGLIGGSLLIQEPAPEPSSLVLMALSTALAGILGIRYRSSTGHSPR